MVSLSIVLESQSRDNLTYDNFFKAVHEIPENYLLS
jgi:hypothetical protein